MRYDEVTRDSVLAAMERFEGRDRDEVLEEHGFRRALDYVVDHEGTEYDSKALYGIAYGIQFPDRPPARDTPGFTGGADTVVRALTNLGFAVRRRKPETSVDDVSTGGRVWLVRAGREGVYEGLAIDQGVTLIGWSEMGALSLTASRDDLKARIEAVWDEHRPQSLASQAGQIYRFLHDISIDDLVVLPRMSKPGHVAVARVLGEYEHRTDEPFQGTDAQTPGQWNGSPPSCLTSALIPTFGKPLASRARSARSLSLTRLSASSTW
jgi:hypothetical protein